MPNAQCPLTISNGSKLRTYTLFGKISWSFHLMMSIFESVNRPY
ncbi:MULTISPECIES: hypothetical protein [Calothrix]|nr:MULTISPECIES: hypothetical protein [Calothrix]